MNLDQDIIHDIFNITLAIIVGKLLYDNRNSLEHINMSLFADDNDYSESPIINKCKTSQKSNNNDIKSKLEDREQYYLNMVNYLQERDSYLKNRDRKVVLDELYPPEKRVERNQYVYQDSQLPINIRTRGEPDDYQLVGLLYNPEGNKNYHLYGRRTYPGSYEWEYYILAKDAGGLNIKFPLHQKNEIMENTNIKVPLDNIDYKVKIYNYDQPRYNPFIY
jgi:hypothetical protein